MLIVADRIVDDDPWKIRHFWQGRERLMVRPPSAAVARSNFPVMQAHGGVVNRGHPSDSLNVA
jgi:hypothetical protein